jgi:hypothetical protein
MIHRIARAHRGCSQSWLLASSSGQPAFSAALTAIEYHLGQRGPGIGSAGYAWLEDAGRLRDFVAVDARCSNI